MKKEGGALRQSTADLTGRPLDLPGSRVRRRARTREEIVRVAQEVILEVGQEAFSLREVARRADYAPSALYKYFEDKDALIGAVATEALQILGSYMGAVPTDLSPGERVVRLSEAYLCYAEEYPRHFALIFGRLVAGVPSWEVYVQVAWPFTLVVDACRTGVEGGVFRVRPGFGPAEMALGCWSLIHGAAALLQDHLTSLQTELRPAVREACRTYVRGLMSDAHESDEASPQ